MRKPINRKPHPKKAKTKKPKPQDKNQRPLGQRAQVAADAKAGKMPVPPDFSAETHSRYRDKLAALVKLADKKDLKALKAFAINAISTSPKALDRYRGLAVTALTARASKG